MVKKEHLSDYNFTLLVQARKQSCSNASSQISFTRSSLFTKGRNRMKTGNKNSKIAPHGTENLYLEDRLSHSIYSFSCNALSLSLSHVVIIFVFFIFSPLKLSMACCWASQTTQVLKIGNLLVCRYVGNFVQVMMALVSTHGHFI